MSSADNVVGAWNWLPSIS